MWSFIKRRDEWKHKLAILIQREIGIPMYENEERTTHIHFDDWSTNEDRQNNKLTFCDPKCINLSETEIKNYKKELRERKYNTRHYKILLLQVILHEIAHCKQWKKKLDKGKAYIIQSEEEEYYDECLADRYALRYYKKYWEALK